VISAEAKLPDDEFDAMLIYDAFSMKFPMNHVDIDNPMELSRRKRLSSVVQVLFDVDSLLGAGLQCSLAQSRKYLRNYNDMMKCRD
jgi:hypothetical protein